MISAPRLIWSPGPATATPHILHLSEDVVGAIALIRPHSQIATGTTTSRTDKRQREHAAGRQLCNLAQTALNLPVQDVPRGDAGQPVWPADRCGSIAHSDTVAIAVVARRPACRSVGVDIERRNAVDDALRPVVLTASEQEKTPDGAGAATQVFAAKEAAYKAIFPLEGARFGFQEITISLSACGRHFTASSTLTQRNRWLQQGLGYLANAGDHLAALFLLPEPAAPETERTLWSEPR